LAGFPRRKSLPGVIGTGGRLVRTSWDESQREITREPALHVRDEHLFESGIGWPRRTDHLLQGVLAWKQIHHVIVLALISPKK
jgi:hypothetical protein